MSRNTGILDRILATPSGACFSAEGDYRYVLWRCWDYSKPLATFIGLNPSTADAERDDPTIRRCVGFAKSWGCGGLLMVNLFALRATQPEDMLRHETPVGERNDDYVRFASSLAKTTVAAWGAHGVHMGRSKQIFDLLHGKLHALDWTKGGMPRHPLYLKATLTPKPWV